MDLAILAVCDFGTGSFSCAWGMVNPLQPEMMLVIPDNHLRCDVMIYYEVVYIWRRTLTEYFRCGNKNKDGMMPFV